MKFYLLLLGFIFIAFSPVFAQNSLTSDEKEAAYTKVITQRADKIVVTLGIADSSKAIRVRDVIAAQYRNLNQIHDARNARIKAVKAETSMGKEAIEAKVKGIEDEANAQLDKLHQQYLAALSAELNKDQVDKVKDGMTYGVVNITYSGYVDMIPTLTAVQKDQIMKWLVEAREYAMDAESSDKKHWWFGKYKGRINNYLSAEGYNIQKERADWEKRIKEREAAKKGKSN